MKVKQEVDGKTSDMMKRKLQFDKEEERRVKH